MCRHRCTMKFHWCVKCNFTSNIRSQRASSFKMHLGRTHEMELSCYFTMSTALRTRCASHDKVNVLKCGLFSVAGTTHCSSVHGDMHRSTARKQNEHDWMLPRINTIACKLSCFIVNFIRNAHHSFNCTHQHKHRRLSSKWDVVHRCNNQTHTFRVHRFHCFAEKKISRRKQYFVE